jgi:hypothetical protein
MRLTFEDNSQMRRFNAEQRPQAIARALGGSSND